MIDWIYEDEEVTEMPEGVFGFIYCITYDNNKQYIGKKQILSTKTVLALKNGEQRPNSERVYKNVIIDEDGKVVVSRADKAAARKRGLKAKRTAFDRMLVESKWKAYCGSNETTLTIIKKEIIDIALHKQQLSYKEEYHLFINKAIISDDYLNVNIGGRYFRNKI